MAALSTPETPDLAGYGVSKGDGVVHMQIVSVKGAAASGSMSLRMAREMALTILGMTEGEGGTDG
jgi:hypothetical protein